MYWCGPRDRPLGGAMLRALCLAIILALPTSALACFKAVGELGIDGETFPFHQKVEANKPYLVPAGQFHLTFSLHALPKKKKQFAVRYKIEERKASRLTLVSEGEEDLLVGTKKEIFAKGEEGHPNSIITIKVIDI